MRDEGVTKRQNVVSQSQDIPTVNFQLDMIHNEVLKVNCGERPQEDDGMWCYLRAGKIAMTRSFKSESWKAARASYHLLQTLDSQIKSTESSAYPP